MAGPFSSDFSSDFGLGPALSATLIVTQANATISAAGNVAIVVNLTAVQQNQTLAATASTKVGLAITQANQTLVATGIVPFPTITAPLAVTQASQTLIAAAIAAITFHTATLAITQASQVLTSPAIAPSTPTPTPPPAIGSQTDFVKRLKLVLPDGWFPDSNTPVLDGLLNGIANIWAYLWSLLTYVAQQKRISTATDINLDIISTDFLGTDLPRNSGESDASYRARIQGSIFQEMGTRAAVSAALTRITGSKPFIFEPSDATDTGGYGAAGAVVNTGLAYGLSGGYGSYSLPFQAFIRTTLPVGVTTSSGVQGYGSRGQGTTVQVIGGYGIGAIEYSSGQAELLSASDQEVYAAINAVKPVATIMWVSTQGSSLQSSGGTQSGELLDTNFILDVSRLG